MTILTYRDATPDDAGILSDLGTRSFVETFGHLYSVADLNLFLEKHSLDSWAADLADSAVAMRIAFDGETPVGYAKIGPPTLPFEPMGTPMELRQLYVLKPWQGAGVAADLMDWIIARSRSLGADGLYLSVFTENHRARKFYARYGFEFVQSYAFMVGNHADEDEIWKMTL